MIKIDITRIRNTKLSGIYRLWFDDETLFYIGSAKNLMRKRDKWRENFRIGKMNKLMKYFIKDKTKAIIEVVEIVPDVSKLYEREDFYLNKYFAFPNCLNRSKSWHGKGVVYSAAEKIARAKKHNATLTPEKRKKLGEFFRNMPIEVKHRGHKTLSERGWMKPVNQFDLNGNLIATYRSIKAAARSVKVSHPQIKRACDGINSTSAGFIWKYIKVEDIGRKLNSGNQIHCKKIKQLDKSGNVLREFDSIKGAAKELGIKEESIRSVVNGRQKTLHGLIYQDATISTNQQIESTNDNLQTSLPL